MVWPASLLMVLGIAAIALSEPLTDLATRVMPAAGEVRSHAYRFPSFSVAYPPMLGWLGGALLAAAATWMLAARPLGRTRAHSKGGTLAPRIALGVLLASTFGIYAWLAYPHNAGSGDALIHWVSIHFGRRQDFFYTLVKPLHTVFYDYPHVAQGLLGVVNVMLMVSIGRRLFDGKWVPLLMGASLLGSGTMLMRADGGTDVQLSVACLLAVVLLYLKRSRFGVGAGIFLATLARPPWGLFLVAFVAVEVIFSRETGDEPRPWLKAVLANRFLWENVISFSVLFVAWHSLLQLTGMGWIWSDGQLFGRRPAFRRQPRTIDGFTAYRFSGMYVMHLLWVVPIPVIASCIHVWMRIRSLRPQIRKAFVFIWLVLAIVLALHEYLIFSGFTIKYLSYLVPLTIAAAWFAGRVPRPRGWAAAAAGLTVLLALAPATAYQDAFSKRNERAASQIAELFAPRRSLRELATGHTVATTLGNRRSRDYISYVFRRPMLGEERLVVLRQGTIPPNAVVVTKSRRGYESLPVLWHGDVLYVLGPSPG